MSFAGINYLAVLAAAIAAFITGAVYYGVLGKAWMTAARIGPEQARPTPALFATSLVAEIVMAWVMAGVIGHLGAGQVTLWNGLVSGAFVWLGFMVTTMTVNHRYQGFGWNLTVIDAGHWLAVCLVMGAVIGAMGV